MSRLFYDSMQRDKNELIPEALLLRPKSALVGCIRGTMTKTGLCVSAELDEATYRKSQKVVAEDMQRLALKEHDTLPGWNYTLSPRSSIPTS